MFILYGKKTIHKWKFWKNKSKILYCIVSGLLFSIVYFLGVLTFKFLFGNTSKLIVSGLSMSIGAFIASVFLSIALWYENDRRYKEWLNDNSEKN